MRRALLASIALFAPTATAAPKAPPKKAEPEKVLPAPDVRLELKAGASGKPWSVAVTNTGSVPLRIVADARLLRLHVAPVEEAAPEPTAKKKAAKPKSKAFECELPTSMRSDGRQLLLQPGATWSESFDVRLFCLDRSKELVAGTTVTAHLGWTSPAKKGKLLAPFEVEPANEGDVAAAKEIAAAPIMLDADAFAEPTEAAKGPLVATAGAARSVLDGMSGDVTIHVKNASQEAHTLYARPQLVDVQVLGPRGTKVACSGLGIQPAPILDFVTRLPKNGTWSATATLASLCPQGTFDVPGLYLLVPALHLPPLPKIADALSGDVVASQPQLYRVEIGKEPFHVAPPKAIAKK